MLSAKRHMFEIFNLNFLLINSMMGDFSGDLMVPRENSVRKVFVETCVLSASNNENLPDILRLNVKLTLV